MRFGWPWATFLVPFHGICACPWPGLASYLNLFALTLHGLNLGTNLHDFRTAPWYSMDSFSLCSSLYTAWIWAWFFQRSFSKFHRPSVYSLKAPWYAIALPNSQQRITNSQQPITNTKQPTTNNQQSITNNQYPTISNQRPTTNKQQLTNNQQPIIQ